MPNDKRVGAVDYIYQFVLINPRTGKPWARHRYALAVDSFPLPTASATSGVEYGITDRNGRTTALRLGVNIPNDKWLVLERVGNGPYGQRFQLVSASGNLMGNQSYQMVICTSPIVVHGGYTDSRGYVAYAANKNEIKLRVMVGSTYRKPTLRAICADMANNKRAHR